MPPRSPFPMFSSGSDSRAALLQGLMIGAIVVGTLYIAREVLLPLTLAILLSFVLTPLLLLKEMLRGAEPGVDANHAGIAEPGRAQQMSHMDRAAAEPGADFDNQCRPQAVDIALEIGMV